MFKNLHLKILALALATLFWIFVVSLENNFLELPEELSVSVFNLAPELALSSEMPSVKLTVRAEDQSTLRRLSPSDFEAYVDLRDSGAGAQNIPVSVTSRNPLVNVVRITPSNINIELSPVRKKIFSLVTDIEGFPGRGFKVQSSRLSRDTVTVSGAENLLKKVDIVRAHVVLNGNERQNIVKPAEIQVLDNGGQVLGALKVEDQDIELTLEIREVEATKEVGVRVKLVGALANGVVKKIEVSPAVISVAGSRDVLDKLEMLETEPIDLKDVTESMVKKVKLVLPNGVSGAGGQANEVTVKLEIEPQPKPELLPEPEPPQPQPEPQPQPQPSPELQ